MCMTIMFTRADRGITLNNRVVLKEFLQKRAKKEGLEITHLNYVFCSDKFLLEINKQFLQHDFYTDIISFDLSETSGILNAEVYISVDRVKDNAKQHNTTLISELHRVIFHGLLHFCGYKDKKSKDAKLMREMEDKWLRAYLKLIG